MWLRRPKRSPAEFGHLGAISGLASDPVHQARMAQNERAFGAYNTAKKSDAGRQFWQGAITAAAAPFAAAGVGAMGAGGPAGSAATSSGYSSPGVFSGMFGGGAPNIVAPVVTGSGGASLGSILNSDALGLGVGAVTNWLGNRSQNKTNRYVADLQAKNTAETLALERQRLEQEMTNANLDRADAMKLQEAVNELKRRELDAAEEERAYTRSLIEARELRAAPRREMSARAMRSLGSILGF